MKNLLVIFALSFLAPSISLANTSAESSVSAFKKKKKRGLFKKKTKKCKCPKIK